MKNLFNVKCLVLASVVVAIYYANIVLRKSHDHRNVMYISSAIVFSVSVLVIHFIYNRLYACKHSRLSFIAALGIASVCVIGYYVSDWVFVQYPQFKDTCAAVVLDNDVENNQPDYMKRDSKIAFQYYMKHVATWIYFPFALALFFYILMAWYDHIEQCEWKMHGTPISLPTMWLKPISYERPPKDHLKKFTIIGSIFYASIIILTIVPMSMLSHLRLQC